MRSVALPEAGLIAALASCSTSLLTLTLDEVMLYYSGSECMSADGRLLMPPLAFDRLFDLRLQVMPGMELYDHGTALHSLTALQELKVNFPALSILKQPPRHMAALSGLTSLTNLALVHSGLDDSSVTVLGALSRLVLLNLQYSERVGSHGMSALAATLTGLHALNVGHTSVTSVGFVAKLGALESLDLSGLGKGNPGGIEDMHVLRGLLGLRVLSLAGTYWYHDRRVKEHIDTVLRDLVTLEDLNLAGGLMGSKLCVPGSMEKALGGLTHLTRLNLQDIPVPCSTNPLQWLSPLRRLRELHLFNVPGKIVEGPNAPNLSEINDGSNACSLIRALPSLTTLLLDSGPYQGIYSGNSDPSLEDLLERCTVDSA